MTTQEAIEKKLSQLGYIRIRDREGAGKLLVYRHKERNPEKLIYIADYELFKELVEKAISGKMNLYDANLEGDKMQILRREMIGSHITHITREFNTIVLNGFFRVSVCYESDCATMKELVEKAVRAKANLTNANLHGANLSGAELAGANLRYVDLKNANLEGADLYKAKLGRLTKADLRNANLSQANFRFANLTNADLRGANLVKANLRGVKLEDADLTNADLTGADLRGVDLRKVKLQGAKLIGARLENAKINASDFENTNLFLYGAKIEYKADTTKPTVRRQQ